MNPTDFHESNFRLLPPPSMPECLPLACHRYPPQRRVELVDYDPFPLLDRAPERFQETREVVEPGGYISRWEPTPEERAAIAAGGPVWVYVVGDGAPPPIAVSGLSPFVAPIADDPSAIYRPGIEASGGDVATGLDPDAKPAAYDLAERCVCGHPRGEHSTFHEDDPASRGGFGDGHCGACPCPAFLPAAEHQDPFLDGQKPGSWGVVDGAALLGKERHDRLLALGTRGRAGETLTAAEMEEHRALAAELDGKVFAQMERPAPGGKNLSRQEWQEQLRRLARDSQEEEADVEREVVEGLLAHMGAAQAEAVTIPAPLFQPEKARG